MTRCSIPTCWSRWLPATRWPMSCCGGRDVRFSASQAEAAQRIQQLAELLRPEIAREDLQKLYTEIELPLASVLAEVEAEGVRIDKDILTQMSGEFDRELTALTQEIYDLAGGSLTSTRLASLATFCSRGSSYRAASG